MQSSPERLKIAQGLWNKVYRPGGSDRDLMRELEHMSARLRAMGDRELGLAEASTMVATTKWIDAGAPAMVTDAKYAAALMCSKVSSSMSTDLILPWRAFQVRLPAGLLMHDDYSYSEILFFSSEEKGTVGSALLLIGERPDPNGGRVSVTDVKMGPDVTETLFDHDEDDMKMVHERDGSALRPDADDAKARVIRMATRLVVGLLYTLQFTTNWRPAAPSLNDTQRALRTGPPKHRTIFVGKPISLDARPAVASYCLGTRDTCPSVQTLVRGHYKRQVIGVSRTGRKVIWVEPYWRGPEDAPILARPYHVGGAS